VWARRLQRLVRGSGIDRPHCSCAVLVRAGGRVSIQSRIRIRGEWRGARYAIVDDSERAQHRALYSSTAFISENNARTTRQNKRHKPPTRKAGVLRTAVGRPRVPFHPHSTDEFGAVVRYRFMVFQAHPVWSEIDRNIMWDDFPHKECGTLEQAEGRYKARRSMLVAYSDMDYGGVC
jgi:hypothetical protein